MLLFLQDTDESLDILKFYGVDTSGWTTAFEPLVGKQVLQIGERYGQKLEGERNDHRGRRDDAHPAGRMKSERSRSPRRRSDSGFGRPRSRSPLHRSPYPVYIVDVKRLYATMKKMPCDKMTLAAIAEDLDVRLDSPDGNGHVTPGGWCAGNECR
jgi:hypothetical protein